ncbi:DHS-like NAD/FAD-binding domain-containing protein [Globomyces pollinis-pini]|nr:DHS-like NAD/FAD-binding domain-containing protein [Globomyces pollinis-pini]
MTSQILNISKHLLNAKRVLVIDGAGISVDAGIPDFRSEMGLYELVKSKYPGVVTTGKDLFDAALFRNPTQTALFYSFIAALKVLSDNASITKTHLFIKMLADTQKLLRCYTQNIDDLHERCGLIPGMDKTAQVVQMHGNLTTVKCTLCSLVKEFDSSTLSLFDDGKAPPCPDCMDKSQIRLAMGKRAINVGTLRPNIVLYNEHHAQGDSIAQLQNFDLKKRPDLLFVMGTSLKIPGVKNLIKSISELMKSTTTKSRPIIVYVNMTRAGREWEEIFDYQLLGPSDQTCTLLWDKLNDLTAEAESRRAKRLLRKQKEEKIEAKITDYFPVKKGIVSY